MKKIYSVRHLMAFLSFFYCFSLSVNAQTMPEGQKLPYKQNFTGLGTTFPLGIQGWSASTPSSLPTPSNFTTSGTIVGNKGLTAGSASSTSGDVYNFNDKIGILNAGSFLDQAIGLALETTNFYGIQVQYDAMVIRNPTGVGSPATTRVNEFVLQYRVGTTAAFTTLPTTVYVNNSTQKIGAGDTSAQNPQVIKVTLPSDCDNQPVVQLRWIARQLSGSGSRPSFAIDNIDVNSDHTAPVNETGFPKSANISSTHFDFSDKLNEIGKTYYVLLADGNTVPTPAQVKAGLDANGNAALQAGFLTIADASSAYTKNIAGLTLSTAYSVFSVSEDEYGNLQTAVNKVDVTTTATALPVVTTSVGALDLGSNELNLESASKSYQIQAMDLLSDLTVSVTPNFSISKDNVTFASMLTYAAADFASNASQTVYVRFNPNLAGAFTGQITHESTSVIKNLSLEGRGINPYVQNFDDPNVLSNSGWTQYDAAGTANKWAYTTTARNVNSGTGAVFMNGYSDAGSSKDWLISPKLRLDTFDKLPLLSFYSRKFYPGPALKLMVSTNYDGVSSPETAVWTEIDGSFPTTTGSYVQSQYIDLSAFKTSHTYVAWVYETTIGGGTGNASEWSFDDYAIVNESAYVASNPVLDFGTVDQNTISTSQSFTFKAKGYGDVTIIAPAGYQISVDNSLFQNSIILTEADAFAGKTLYARFAPTVKEFKIAGPLTVTGTSLNKQIGSLTGSSLPKAETFDVVTYNLEFFGTDVKGTDNVEFGPTDDALQIENVAKVMNKLNADVYVVQEVSDDPSIDELIKQININGKTFDKSISTSWSYSFNAADPNFPPQKLVVLYNTQTTTVKKTRVMFKELYDDVRANTVTLSGYPGGNDDSFFSSGRLPYLVQIETNIGGVTKEINLIDLHARANSGTDIGRYNMRKYDAQFLKDSLDVHYPNSNLIILGDFNDDVKASVVTPNPSSYEAFVTDTSNYNALTLGISQAGTYSFLSSGGFLDHIIISNELTDEYIANSIAVYDPRTDIANYTTNTSDHGPVIARFELKEDNLGTIDFETNKGFAVKVFPNPATDVFNISVKSNIDKNLKFRIYDLNGRLVNNPSNVTAGQDITTTSIPVSHLQKGIYIYTLTENNKVVCKGKIIK
ncbi:T9SS-dependent choice-of-anchor J family protein [Flavobacterium salmonis]|uniref:Endonuclease n=1 Tax=Flavobacterium salmonis TaxID=2654844 RepID=A0A6V6Z089_9FLAO|nr:T9SS type A sorting domain-containing protein [Flavobacterium salmonis]CAD0005095.1 endonuclease [Flavobacterium salmonis]